VPLTRSDSSPDHGERSGWLRTCNSFARHQMPERRPDADVQFVFSERPARSRIYAKNDLPALVRAFTREHLMCSACLGEG
jgi:hypothetical protein